MYELTKIEFKNLSEKVNNNAIVCDYFRRNLFNVTSRSSEIYKNNRKKIIYRDEKVTIKVNRSLHQRHRDLLSLLAFEKKTNIQEDGSYEIHTKIYQLAKKMYDKNPKNHTKTIKNLLEDMQSTLLNISIDNLEYTHTLLDHSEYDKDLDYYIIKVPAKTAKYYIYASCVSITEEINDKIVKIENSKSRLKALITFILSNKKLKNGMYFNTICDKLDITDKTVKSRFKKQILANLELLKEFKIEYKDDKLYLLENTVKFYNALTMEALINFKEAERKKIFDKKLADIMSHKNENIVMYRYTTANNIELKIKFKDEKLAIFSVENDDFVEFLDENRIEKLVNIFINQESMYNSINKIK